MEVNGKEYPLWSQFIERKGEWIGGILSDLVDGISLFSSIVCIFIKY